MHEVLARIVSIVVEFIVTMLCVLGFCLCFGIDYSPLYGLGVFIAVLFFRMIIAPTFAKNLR